MPISGSRRVACSQTVERNDFVLAVHSGSKPDLAPREWRFTTRVPKMRASYLERWVPTNEKRKRYYLMQAYLHLYWREGPREDDEKEILALHCDPNEPGDAGTRKHALYKRGPHIHVVDSSQPLPHAHFALNVGHLSEVLRSVESLTAAVLSGVNLVRDQVLDLFEIDPP